MTLNFPKFKRLITKSDFQNLKNGSRFFISGPLIFYLKDTEQDNSRLGLAVSRKYGNAVRRNRFKRIIRDQFRHTEFKQSVDILVVPNLRLIKSKKLTFKNLELELSGAFSEGCSKLGLV